MPILYLGLACWAFIFAIGLAVFGEFFYFFLAMFVCVLCLWRVYVMSDFDALDEPSEWGTM